MAPRVFKRQPSRFVFIDRLFKRQSQQPIMDAAGHCGQDHRERVKLHITNPSSSSLDDDAPEGFGTTSGLHSRRFSALDNKLSCRFAFSALN